MGYSPKGHKELDATKVTEHERGGGGGCSGGGCGGKSRTKAEMRERRVLQPTLRRRLYTRRARPRQPLIGRPERGWQAASFDWL